MSRNTRSTFVKLARASISLAISLALLVVLIAQPLAAATDIVNQGSTIRSAGAMLLRAARDVKNEAFADKYTTVDSYAAARSCTWYGKCTYYETRYYDEASILRPAELIAGTDLTLIVGRDHADALPEATEHQDRPDRLTFTRLIHALADRRRSDQARGATLVAASDLSLRAGGSVTIDAEQNQRYIYEQTKTFGFTFKGFDIIKSLASGDGKAAFQQYLATNPMLAAVHQLATAKGKWGTTNGLIALGVAGMNGYGSAVTAMEQKTANSLTAAFAQQMQEQFNPLNLLPSMQAGGYTCGSSSPSDCLFTARVPVPAFATRLGEVESKCRSLKEHEQADVSSAALHLTFGLVASFKVGHQTSDALH